MDGLVIVIILLGVFLYFNYKYKSAQVIGSAGERKVAAKLRWLGSEDYIVLNNLLFKIGKYTSQIDHVVIAKSGIFVIETKNYKGWIHGHERSEYWLQTLYKRKYRLRNPIKQNWSHVYALKEVLEGYGYIKYFPIVVFAGDAKLKNVHTQLPVVYVNRLCRTIKLLDQENKLSAAQMERIANRLLAQNITDRNAIKQHPKLLKEQASERRRNIKEGICPKCGNKLVKRSGAHGKFYGCSQYPQCRYTRGIK